MMSYYACK